MRLGALQGLSKLGQAEALPLLAARVPYGGEAQEMIRADVISTYGAYVANVRLLNIILVEWLTFVCSLAMRVT